MKHDDTDIKEFFDQLRETDQIETEIPFFQLPVTKKKPKQSVLFYLVPAAVAASVLLFFGKSWVNQSAETKNETLVITMTVSEPTTTDDFILTTESSLSNWKFPSDILIQEFED